MTGTPMGRGIWLARLKGLGALDLFPLGNPSIPPEANISAFLPFGFGVCRLVISKYAILAPSTGTFGSQQFAQIAIVNNNFIFAIYVEDYVWEIANIIGTLSRILSLWLGL